MRFISSLGFEKLIHLKRKFEPTNHSQRPSFESSAVEVENRVAPVASRTMSESLNLQELFGGIDV
jgi:hypothetical protein